nr:hypothetical protein [Propionicicella superfundia]
MNPALSVAAIGLVVVATALIGFFGLRVSRTTSDFFVASRRVRPWWNASAISGEYLSVGTFLGLSGLVLLSGTYAFWFPIGYTAATCCCCSSWPRRCVAAAPTRSPTSWRPGWRRRPPAASPASWW